MTDWATSDRPDDMLDAARGLISNRQLLQYGAGCCALAAGRVPHAEHLSKLFGMKSDGKALARDERRTMIDGVMSLLGANPVPLIQMAVTQSEPGPWYSARRGAAMLRVLGRGPDGPWMHGVDREQADLLREIVGDPFRPVTIPEAWRTDAVVRIALMLDDTRDFEMMPVLADALEDAGCEDERVLEHCRKTVHAPGCWVLDSLLLRKETQAVSEAA